MLRFQALVIWSLWPMTLWTSRYLFVYRCYSGFEYCANWNRKVSCLSWLYYNIILLEQAANICDTDAFFCCLDVSILTGHYLMSRSKYAQYCTLFFKICSAYLFLACPTTHSFRQFCAMLLYADLIWVTPYCSLFCRSKYFWCLCFFNHSVRSDTFLSLWAALLFSSMFGWMHLTDLCAS